MTFPSLLLISVFAVFLSKASEAMSQEVKFLK